MTSSLIARHAGNAYGCWNEEDLQILGMSFASHERALEERGLRIVATDSVALLEERVGACGLVESYWGKNCMVSVIKNSRGVLVNSIYAVMIGICGSVLLTVFLAGLLALETTIKTIPWIVGFNAALSGFNLVEKTRGRVVARGYGCLAGLVVGFAAFAILNSLAFYAIGVPILTVKDLMVLVLAGTACGGFGFLLARKYRDLK